MLIDEFQDTDPVQAELALLLTSDQEPNGDWRTLRPAPGRLTVVGDPKQSIYRFRRADIAVYDQVRDGALAGAHEQISTNFRSNPQLLAALNAVFDTVLEREPGVQPGNVELDAPPGRAEREAAADRARDRRADSKARPMSSAARRRGRSPRCCTRRTASGGRSATATTTDAGGRAGGATWRS